MCQSPGRASSTSSAKCTRPRSSSARTAPSLSTAGELHHPPPPRAPPSFRLGRLRPGRPAVSPRPHGLVRCAPECRLPLQRRCGQDRRLHHAQHRAGADAVRRRGGHLPDGEDAADPEASHGADGGEAGRSSRGRQLGLAPLCLSLSFPLVISGWSSAPALAARGLVSSRHQQIEVQSRAGSLGMGAEGSIPVPGPASP